MLRRGESPHVLSSPERPVSGLLSNWVIVYEYKMSMIIHLIPSSFIFLTLPYLSVCASSQWKLKPTGYKPYSRFKSSPNKSITLVISFFQSGRCFNTSIWSSENPITASISVFAFYWNFLPLIFSNRLISDLYSVFK